MAAFEHHKLFRTEERSCLNLIIEKFATEPGVSHIAKAMPS
jgi:hypothetical protein